MIELPDFEERLPADLFLASFFVGLDAFRGREDESAIAVTDRVDLARALVQSAAGLGDALHAFDRMLAGIVVLQADVERLLDLLAFLLDRFHITDFTKLLGDRIFEI